MLLQKSTSSALCVVPPAHVWTSLQAVRARHDKGFCRQAAAARLGSCSLSAGARLMQCATVQSWVHLLLPDLCV